jgi:hypothetical protein
MGAALPQLAWVGDYLGRSACTGISEVFFFRANQELIDFAGQEPGEVERKLGSLKRHDFRFEPFRHAIERPSLDQRCEFPASLRDCG